MQLKKQKVQEECLLEMNFITLQYNTEHDFDLL